MYIGTGASGAVMWFGGKLLSDCLGFPEAAPAMGVQGLETGGGMTYNLREQQQKRMS